MFVDAPQLYLPVSEGDLDRLWQQTQSFSTKGYRWQAYLNRICLHAMLPWIREELAPGAKVWTTPAALPSFWEFVSGTAICFANSEESIFHDRRLILIPTTEIDLSEFRVPQEWVDIPSWAADYYVAVQVEPDAGWVKVWGYATHQQLKTQGRHDSGDRSYALDVDDLIQNIGVLGIAHQICPAESLRADVAALPAVPLTQAENLLDRLGNPDVIVPRLAIPFALWGALLEHGGWRQQLYERRQGLTAQWSVWQWLQTGVSTLAQQVGWGTVELQSSPVLARGSEAVGGTVLSRQLTIAGKPYELRVLPHEGSNGRTWRFELRSAALGSLIPGGFTLRLLTEDLQPFSNNEDSATTAVDQLYVDVTLEPGDALVWETEPMPEDYDREVLRF